MQGWGQLQAIDYQKKPLEKHQTASKSPRNLILLWWIWGSANMIFYNTPLGPPCLQGHVFLSHFLDPGNQGGHSKEKANQHQEHQDHQLRPRESQQFRSPKVNFVKKELLISSFGIWSWWSCTMVTMKYHEYWGAGLFLSIKFQASDLSSSNEKPSEATAIVKWPWRIRTSALFNSWFHIVWVCAGPIQNDKVGLGNCSWQGSKQRDAKVSGDENECQHPAVVVVAAAATAPTSGTAATLNQPTDHGASIKSFWQ